MDKDLEPIVCDIGTSLVKAGFAGDDAPRAVFPCAVGHTKTRSKRSGWTRKEYLLGDEVDGLNIGEFTLNWPVDGGIVIDWDDIERVYHHTFYNELQIAPEEHPVHLTETTLKHDANYDEKRAHRQTRERTCQIMFETFNVPAMYVSPQPVLALTASGAVSGLVLDSGVTNSQCVPIYEQQIATHAIHKFGLGGRDLTNHMTQILKKQGYRFSKKEEPKIVRDIKEKLGYVAIDYEEELKLSETSTEVTKSYELPDGEIISIDVERFKCPEAFFKPLMVKKDIDGIHKVVYDSIMMCDDDEDIRKELFGTIVVCGGSSLFPGFADRLKKEVSKLVEDNTSINIVEPLGRRFSVWTGGSVLASLSTFQQKWVTKSDYDENGPSIVHDRCC